MKPLIDWTVLSCIAAMSGMSASGLDVDVPLRGQQGWQEAKNADEDSKDEDSKDEDSKDEDSKDEDSKDGERADEDEGDSDN
ncbi:MAG TPA: hypothetical protein PKL73_05590 [Polyangiaceae bacterium]|jgi:hypothetical protein|nr:MAG: hypothetical protein BWY17_03930 [Deltaproteobacteria bacterium ADurb.Bin207]HNS96402.1 hypothetical protein [Polyangiaceae bacterium]HOD21298.1 hypothetical protein [Polyangiaceae bacterium]HOH00506.1 hypothetical protein [Polyangiaceae bacterium]HOR35886.1 hypothetical protein [Polyangiaceae bacterium]